MLIGMGLALVLIPYGMNRSLFWITIIFSVALATGIVVGIFGSINKSKLLFEFQYWRSLVFFIMLTFLISKLMSPAEYGAFINWFVIVQFIYCVIVLTGFFFFGRGQFSNVGQLVPIFAGDSSLLSYWLASSSPQKSQLSRIYFRYWL